MFQDNSTETEEDHPEEGTANVTTVTAEEMTGETDAAKTAAVAAEAEAKAKKREENIEEEVHLVQAEADDLHQIIRLLLIVLIVIKFIYLDSIADEPRKDL